jgi:hypothetical protein
VRRLIAALLLMVPCAASAQQKVPLVLHHLMVVIDSATWNDVVNSPFIKDQFAASEAPFANGIDGSRLIRLFGKYNFLQLMPPHPPYRPVGDIGIALASQRAGGLEQVRAQGSFKSPEFFVAGCDHCTQSTDLYHEASDWLLPAGPDSMSAHVDFVLVQYTAKEAQAQFVVDSLPATNLSNSRFLGPLFDPKKLFNYLSGATLAIPVDDIKKISRVLQRDSIAVIAEGEGAIIKLDGFTLHLVPSFIGAGVKQLQFALTRTALGNPIYQFGQKSQLRFGPGPIATWNFNWP